MACCILIKWGFCRRFMATALTSGRGAGGVATAIPKAVLGKAQKTNKILAAGRALRVFLDFGTAQCALWNVHNATLTAAEQELICKEIREDLK
eukprot:12402660-Karenia_brevis.AAC.1